jgi:hypothetical protein
VKVKGGDTLNRVLTEDMLVLIANQVKAGPVRVHLRLPEEPQGVRRQQGPQEPARLAGERYSFTQAGWRKPWARR